MLNIPSEIWPPRYSIRKSLRARQIILQISPKHGLQVVVPHQKRDPNIEKIEKLLAEKRSWIEKNLEKLKQTHLSRLIAADPSLYPYPYTDSYSYPLPISPPTSLNFQAVQKTISFTYIKTHHQTIKIKPHSGDQYWVFGPIENNELIFKALKHFVKQQAEVYLIPWLKYLSIQTSLPFSSSILRRQSTLWGSCTATKKISLNIKLLFLPQALSQYVLLHELCHTQHLNHSKRFWNLLTKFDPNCLNHRKALRHAEQYIPEWL